MSRGLGRTQLAVIATLKASEKPLTIRELAAVIYGEPTSAREQVIRDTLASLEGKGALSLHRSRVGSWRKHGWRHVVGLRPRTGDITCSEKIAADLVERNSE